MAAVAQVGVWRDYSRSDGFTSVVLTLDGHWGNLLLTTLALLITVAGAALWSILAFAIHQYRSRQAPVGALHLQTQVILRNSTGAISTLVSFFWLVRAWNGHTRRLARNIGLLSAAPLLVWIIFTLAGIFVGKIVSPISGVVNVRLAQQNCGLPVPIVNTSQADVNGYAINNANDVRIAAAFVDNCYDTPDGSFGCVQYPVQKLPYTQDTINCPFPKSFCITNASFQDTGFLDTNDHLGINAPSDEHLDFRLVKTCTVIDLRNLTRSVPEADAPNSTYRVLEIYAGPRGSANWTYQYFTRLSEIEYGYSLETYSSYAGSSSYWTPIRQLNLTNADINLHFIAANAVRYLAPSNDPLFTANETDASTLGDGSTLYVPYQYVNGLLCTDQWELRNPVNGLSTATCGYQQLNQAASRLKLSVKQQATASRLLYAFMSTRNAQIVRGQGTNALQAGKLLDDFVSAPIPDDQWKREAEYWFKTSLAALQRAIVEYPVNSWSSKPDIQNVLVVSPPSEYEYLSQDLEALCSQQRVQSTGAYVNFVFPAVILVIVVCVLIIAISLVLPTLVNLLPSRGAIGSRRHKYRAYIADSQLSLLRMALDGQESDGWRGCNTTEPWRDEADGNAELFTMPVEASGNISYARAQHDEAVQHTKA